VMIGPGEVRLDTQPLGLEEHLLDPRRSEVVPLSVVHLSRLMREAADGIPAQNETADLQIADSNHIGLH